MYLSSGNIYFIERLSSLNRKRFFLMVLFTLIIKGSYAQIPSYKQVIPPSPASAEFNKYINHQANPSNGIPNISVPLYTIRTGQIELPLELNYHASGIKYEAEKGELGLGWSLSPGFRISRTIYGRADEHHPMPLYQGLFSLPLHPARDTYLAKYISNGAGTDPDIPASGDYYDGEYDLFTFSTISDRGNFLIKDRVNKEIKLISETNTKIAYTTEDNSGIVYMDVWDANGIYYRMGKSKITGERAFEHSHSSSSMYTARAPTSWLVTDIEDPNGNYVRFSYQNFHQRATSRNLKTLNVMNGGRNVLEMTPTSVSHNLSEEDNPYSVAYLASITTKDCKIDFIRNIDGGLLEIQIKDNNNVPIKTINFYTSNNAYFLDAVEIKGADNIEVERFGFDYYNKDLNPFSGVFIADYWGYNKLIGPGAAELVFPQFGPIQYCELYWIGPLTNRVLVGEKRVLSYANADKTVLTTPSYFSLSKISYPSGGYTTYEYESNKYYDNENPASIKQQGLRIKEIKVYDGIKPDPLIYIYKYNEKYNTDGAGIVHHDLANNYHFKTTRPFVVLDWAPGEIRSFVHDFYNSHPTAEILEAFSLNQPVLYNEVSIYQKSGTGSAFNGKTIYNYSSTSYWDSKAVASFFNNTDFIRLNSWDCGAQQISLSSPDYYINSYNLSSEVSLDSVRTYRSDGNLYSLVNKESYQYQNILSPTLTGLKVRRFVSGNVSYSPAYNYYSEIYNGLSSLFHYASYQINCNTRVLKHKSIFNYLNGEELKTDFNYTYNGRALLEKTVQENSNGEKNIEIMKYPFDYSITGVPGNPIAKGIQKLQSKNMVKPIIEKYHQKSNADGSNLRTLSSLFTVYDENIPLPVKIYSLNPDAVITDFAPTSITSGSSVIDARYKEELSFSRYDSFGNLLQQQKTNSPSQSYLWDYKESHPIAQVINADHTSIAYTSFEAESKGNWLYTGSSVTDASAVAGKKVFQLDNAGANGIEKTGLNSSDTYIVSYWTKNGAAFTIAGTKPNYPVTGRTLNGWTHFEHRVTGQTTIKLSGTGVIDELSLYPENALINTYIYKPLTGVISTTDPKGMTTYYEYDNFQRLKSIKDQNGNVLKSYNYHYKQQPN